MRLPSSRLTTGLLLRKAGNARSSALASFSSATEKSVRIDNLFDRMDSNNDGLLDRDDFHKALHDPPYRTSLKAGSANEMKGVKS